MFYIAIALFAYWAWGALYITRAVRVTARWQKLVEAQHLADGRTWTKSKPMEEIHGFCMSYTLGSMLMGGRALSADLRMVFLNGVLESIYTSYPEVTQEEYSALATAFQPLLTE